MKQHILSLVIVAAASLSTGCAAMFTGTKDDVMFQTTPPGATVIAGDVEGVTPCTLSVSKKTNQVTFRRAGREETVEWKRSVMGWMIFMPDFMARAAMRTSGT